MSDPKQLRRDDDRAEVSIGDLVASIGRSSAVLPPETYGSTSFLGLEMKLQITSGSMPVLWARMTTETTRVSGPAWLKAAPYAKNGGAVLAGPCP
jgi:hypothetical protein